MSAASGRHRRTAAVGVIIAVALLAACGGGSSGRSSASASTSASGSAGNVSAFCEAYGRYLDAGKSSPSSLEEVHAVLVATRSALDDASSAAPSEVKADVVQVSNEFQHASSVIDRYSDDIDAALASASGDDATVLNDLAEAPAPDSPGGHVRTYARTACPGLDVPSDAKFSSVGSEVN